MTISGRRVRCAGKDDVVGSHGIRDRVAIVGMGCTPFAEHWDKGLDDLIVDASTEAFASAGVTKEDVDAYWFGTAQSGMSGIALARPLQLHNKPVTRVENYCATGAETLRAAAYAVASGAYDVAMAVGAEKVKDSGFQGLNGNNPPNDGTARTLTAAAMFSMVAPAYGQKYGVDEETMADVLATIAVKNHHNGARNSRAQFRKEISKETVRNSPRLAGSLGVFDCAGVADGAAAAIVVRAEDALKYTDKPIYLKALSFVAGSGSGLIDPGYDYTHFPECEAAAADAYHQAGITDPRSQLAMAEVHDCFTPTELVLMEDLGFAPRGTAWKEVLAGTFALDGDFPVNPDGGLKSFGHPVGASGLRMFFECWLQMRGEAPAERQIATTDRGLAMTHNLGGYPGEMLSFVSVMGNELG
jgi:acetyl-CoA C-acetyltransferase